MGREEWIPFKLAMVATIPVWLMASVFVFGCGGRSDCDIAADYTGFSSGFEYMITDVLMEALLPMTLFAGFIESVICSFRLVDPRETGNLFHPVRAQTFLTYLILDDSFTT